MVGPHESPLREAIHAFKYAGRRDTGTRLAALLVERWQDAPIAVDGVIPVPLHEARERERGYNQSRVLAEPFACQAGLPLRPGVLERTRPTPPQVGLDRAGRLDNVAGAFQATIEALGGRWLLVDDVCTTGATLEACAAALRSAGATSVWAITLARPHAHEGAGSPGNL